ncbi:hypothetical protein ACOSP7_015416 [Xanthoceras sorbifolium]
MLKTDYGNDCGMGTFAELSWYCLLDAGAFAWEITLVEVSWGRRRPSTVVDKDEGLRKFDPAKLRKVPPSFKDTRGIVTVGNASSIRFVTYNLPPLFCILILLEVCLFNIMFFKFVYVDGMAYFLIM